MDPARIFTESLTPRPELENSQGQKQTSRRACDLSALPPKADKQKNARLVRFVPLTTKCGAVNSGVFDHFVGSVEQETG
jgi:urease alpha subunit